MVSDAQVGGAVHGILLWPLGGLAFVPRRVTGARPVRGRLRAAYAHSAGVSPCLQCCARPPAASTVQRLCARA